MAKARAKRSPRSRIRRHPIEQWSEFVDIIQSWSGFRNWAFRGQADAEWPLQSSRKDGARGFLLSAVGTALRR
jgi:hypothetical protein